MTAQQYVLDHQGEKRAARALVQRMRAFAASADAWLRPQGQLSWDRCAGLLFLLAAALVVFTFSDYGVTWDEDVHNWYGVFVLDYYTSFFKDTRALNWLNLYNYGAAFDLAAAALNRLSPIGTYETRHLLNGIVGIVGLVGTWKLGRALGAPRAGFIAALLLLLTPNYYGQMFNNPKDIPFAVASVWATYYMVRIVPALPAPRWSLLVKMGVAIGLALGVRVGGLLLACYLGLLLALWSAWRLAEHRSMRLFLSDGVRLTGRVMLPMIAAAWPVMLLCWPWAQVQPIENPLRSLAFFTHETFPFNTLFAGRYWPASDLPWDYLPTYIVLALPELTLLLLCVTPVAAAIALWRTPRPGLRDAALRYFVLAFGIVFPVGYAVAVKAVLFDGMRHFIFVLPLIAVAAALVADRSITWLAPRRWRIAVYTAVAVWAGTHVSIMVALHPDQYVYYNALVGGTKGAQGEYKLDYWANSYAEAVEGLETYLKNELGADFADRDFRVAVCGPPISADYFFPKNFIFTRDRDNADFFIAFTKDDCHKSLPGKEIYRVERMGALLSVVIDRRQICEKRNRPPAIAHSGADFAVGSELE